MGELRSERSVAPVVALRRISWGGILAGAILALMIQFMLGLLGLGIGLTSSTGGSGNLFSLAGLWAVFIVLIGVFAGAYAAARFAGIPSRIDGMLHGVVTWAVTGLFALYLLTSGAAGLVGGAFGVLGRSVDELAASAQALAPGTTQQPAFLKDGAELLFTPVQKAPPTDGEAADEADAPPVAPPSASEREAAYGSVVAAVSPGVDDASRSAAVDAIVRTTGADRAEAERRFEAFAAQASKARADREAARQRASAALATAALGAFAAMLLGMVVGGIGGMLGRPGRSVDEKPSRH